MRTLLQRFEEKYIPEPNSGCWLWEGALTRGGYGNTSATQVCRIVNNKIWR